MENSNSRVHTERDRARRIAQWGSVQWKVAYVNLVACTANISQSRLAAAVTVACQLHRDVWHCDVDQAIGQSELDTEIFLILPPPCGRLSRESVWAEALKQSVREWCKLLFSSTMVDSDFHQCLVGPFVFRLMVNDEVVAMLVAHVDGIKPPATNPVTDSARVLANLYRRFPSKHLSGAARYIGSE